MTRKSSLVFQCILVLKWSVSVCRLSINVSPRDKIGYGPPLVLIGGRYDRVKEALDVQEAAQR